MLSVRSRHIKSQADLKKPRQQQIQTPAVVIEIESDDEIRTPVSQSSESIEADASDDESWNGISDSELDVIFKLPREDLANSRSATGVDAITLESRKTTPRQTSEDGSCGSKESDSTITDGQHDSEDEQPSPQQKSSAGIPTHCKRSLDNHALSLEKTCKRPPKSKADQQGIESTDGIKPRRSRKVSTESFSAQLIRDGLWMGHTTTSLKEALTLCDELEQDLKEEEVRLRKRRKTVEKQRAILQDSSAYIYSCGAMEEKVTRRWEKS